MTTSPAWYDSAMVGRNAPAMLELNESPWLPLYREAAGWIPYNHDVVDLGCGTGRFLSLLVYESARDADSTLLRSLAGVDFSPDALAEADRYLLGLATLGCEDLREWEPDPMRAGNTTYTCLETLEHLEDDRDLVRRIPPGHQFVFSVPSYESESHLRVFRNVGDVWKRYSDLLAFRRWTLIPIDERKAIHCLDTVRRQDAW